MVKIYFNLGLVRFMLTHMVFNPKLMLSRLLLITTCVFISNLCISQSKLERAKESLKKQENSINASTKNIGNNKNDEEEEKSLAKQLFAETFGRLLVNIFAYTAYGILVEAPFEKDSPNSRAILTKQPYLNPSSGNYTYEWGNNSTIGRTAISSRYIFENSNLSGNHLNIDMRFYNRLAVEIDYLQLWENNPNFGYNTLAIYTGLVKYHRIRTKRFDGWWGIGASYVDGSVDDFGFSFGLGTEIFIGNPISLESNFNHTLINNSTLGKFNALINYYVKHYKFNGGYEYLKIGNQSFSTVSVGLGINF